MVAIPPVRYTDIRHRMWFDRHMPNWTWPYARLMRLDRPIGTWLLLLPCWWGLSLADSHGPDFWLMTYFAFGAIIMRGAGCVINDIYDRKLDQQVERTHTRPLASGQIKLVSAVVFLVLLLLSGLRVLMFFNSPTMLLGLLSLILVFTYPLMKRITWWPQLFLGLTFNWGALMGWTAVTGGLTLPPIILYIAGIFWTLGYDTIYAHQDIEDDAVVGIKSTARLFGASSRRWVSVFYLLTVICLGLTGWLAGEKIWFYVGLGIATLVAMRMLVVWKEGDPANCLQRFRDNRDFGLIILAAIIAGRLF